MAKTQFFSGHWLGCEPLEEVKDIVCHGASQTIREFIAGQFSGTTPVTDGNNMEKYSDRELSPNDLDMSNNFNPEIEDQFYQRKLLEAKQAELLMKKRATEEAAKAAHDAEYERYKKYYEEAQKKSSESNSES